MNHIIKEQIWGCKTTLNKGLIILSPLLAKLSGNFEDVSGIYVRRKWDFTTNVLTSGQQLLLSESLVYHPTLPWTLFFQKLRALTTSFLISGSCL